MYIHVHNIRIKTFWRILIKHSFWIVMKIDKLFFLFKKLTEISCIFSENFKNSWASQRQNFNSKWFLFVTEKKNVFDAENLRYLKIFYSVKYNRMRLSRCFQLQTNRPISTLAFVCVCAFFSHSLQTILADLSLQCFCSISERIKWNNITMKQSYIICTIRNEMHYKEIKKKKKYTIKFPSLLPMWAQFLFLFHCNFLSIGRECGAELGFNTGT